MITANEARELSFVAEHWKELNRVIESLIRKNAINGVRKMNIEIADKEYADKLAEDMTRNGFESHTYVSDNDTAFLHVEW